MPITSWVVLCAAAWINVLLVVVVALARRSRPEPEPEVLYAAAVCRSFDRTLRAIQSLPCTEDSRVS